MWKKAGTSKVNQFVAAAGDVPACCPDLREWPQRWMFTKEDLAAGEQIVDCFLPFLQQLGESGLSRKTVRKHVDNLWVLGGEIIRDLWETPELRKRPMAEVVFEAVEEGGILPYHNDSEEQVRSFESTCRKFRRFLEQRW